MKEISESYIVGIGSSEGGLEAINQFSRFMPNNTGITYIICNNVESKDKIHLAEILKYQTNIEVKEITHEMSIEKDTIYVVPQDQEVEIKQGVFQLYEKDTINSKKIDRLFRSLAREKKDKSIGIILSGIGKDGAEGVVAIHNEKGLVIVQNEDTAEFVDKPRKAGATGKVDYVLAPSRMLDIILKHVNERDARYTFLEDNEMEQIFYKSAGVIKEQTGIDLLAYKKSIILKRIQLRMSMLDIEDARVYLDYLKQTPSEINNLYQDVCVGVTKFFRDDEAFKVMEEIVIPNIFRDKEESSEVRIWVAGCSTGEEVYSLLILCEEYFERIGKRYNIKIFATDMNEESLYHASRGIYSEESLSKIPQQIRAKYFTYTREGYSISSELRHSVLFSKHNLVKDIPFSNIDLVTCRNLLVYFEEGVQQTILSMFHFSLNHNGYVFLGSNESIGNMKRYFEVIDKKWKIYKYAGQVKKPKVNTLEHRDFTEYQQKSSNMSRHTIKTSEYEKEQDIKKILKDLEQMYIPKGVIIDESYELIHAIGDVNEYIRIPLSKMSLNISKMIRKEISIPLATALHNVSRDNKPCKYKNIRINQQSGFGYENITLSVVPFTNYRADKKYFVVLFEESEAVDDSLDVSTLMQSSTYERINNLEQELSFNKEHLKSVIEDLEISNEELILSNEELQNINYELQSLNNELCMVNNEYQAKLEEMRHYEEKITELVNLADINMLRLDKELCIREFTSGIAKILNISKSNKGKSILTIKNVLEYDDFYKDIQSALIDLKEKEKIVKNNENTTLKVKITPHIKNDKVITGVIINIMDISNLLNDYQPIKML